MDELTPDQIAANANGAAEMETDGQRVKIIPIPDQIAAAKFAAANAPVARRRRMGGIRVIRFGVDVPS